MGPGAGVPPQPGWCTARPRPSEIGGETIKLVNRRSSASGRGAPGASAPRRRRVTVATAASIKLDRAVGVPGQAWSGVGDVPPNRRRFFSGFVTPPDALRPLWPIALRRGGSTPRDRDCCSVARLTGGEGAPAPRLGAPGSPRDWDSRSRNLPFPANFFEVSIAASSYLGNDQSRSARKGPMAAECSAP